MEPQSRSFDSGISNPFMSSAAKWTEHFSKKTNMFYYFNSEDHSSLWKVDAPERGWGRTLLDVKHPERGEKFVNIYTNRAFNSESEFKNYIQSIQSASVVSE